MKNYIAVLLLILTSCDFRIHTNSDITVNIQARESIDEKTRNIIAEKNQFVVDCIQKKKSNEISKIASENLINEGFNDVIPILDFYGSLMKSNEFHVFGEFHAESSESNVQIEIEENFNRGGDTNKFELRYRSLAEETFLTLLNLNIGSSEILITTLYGNYNREWELDFLSVSTFTSYGLTSPEFYYRSQKYHNDGDIVNAYVFSLFAELTMEPCEGVFYYDVREDIIEHSKSIRSEFEQKFVLPDTLFSIKTQPIIAGLGIRIGPQLDYLPWVQYYTLIDTSNEENIRTERMEVAKQIESIFPGINQNFKTQIYQAYQPELKR